MKVPLARPIMTEEMIEAAADALRNERLTMGESMFKFEEEFAAMCGVKHAVSVSSGTGAIQLSLLAAGIGRGDAVMTSSMSFVATTNAYVAFGGRPAFADVIEAECTIDPAEIAVTQDLKAIMPVHLYGHPARMDDIKAVAKESDLLVIEDACQAHGAKYKGRRAGALGDVGCFSFYPTKNMHVGGDGGMVTTDDEEVAELVRKLRHCGRKSQYEHDAIGYTARLNTANAAVGRIQLRMLDGWNDKRRAVAKRYDTVLDGVGDLALPPRPDADFLPVYHLYTVRTARREALRAHLDAAGVQTGVHYEIPIHLQPIYRTMYGYSEGMLPITERLCKEVVTLPMFPDMTDEQIAYVGESIAGFFAGAE
ncbi:MAG: DegT/DnrJ/EryC1/StrS family aminotransferase [Methanobacteriota archaeon]|nr:MAG: DegT/DnrJ/EryC1/StrS family aminotransferase [Euryarchaeota archaeon]